ncbi:MAG TPA: phage tail protein [Ktedonobacteraceae bacterium]|nr:phage tail protein [Ktedonobacteraceae bacterium]
MQIWSRAANDLLDLADIPWQPEPTPYQRFTGSELPFAPESGVYGTWEILFQQARGRFLQIRLQLSGNGRSSPRVRAMRMYYPRFSYLDRYLPALYRDDELSASFLDRFLANIEGFYTPIEDKLTNIRLLFMAVSAPTEALEWLAGWFGIALDPSWGEARQRLFLEHALDFFQYRGTVRGLRVALRLAFEDCADESIFTDTISDALHQVRIVEKYLTRYASGVVYGDPTDLAGLRATTQAAHWTPDQGRDALNRRYADYIQQLSGQTTQVVDFPLSAGSAWQSFLAQFPGTALTSGSIQSAWQRFSQEVLGFVPSALPDNPQDRQVRVRRWQDFLAHRYHSASGLNATYWQSVASFAEAQVQPFTSLPPDGALLQDWYQFESVVLVMYGTAHRFSVLLPTIVAESQDTLEQRRALAQRIINLEKPAHAIFDVKFFWAYFRIGEARLGLDTLIDTGSRAPQLLPPLVLGHNYLSESYLAPGHPQNVPDRFIIGRGPLVNGPALRQEGAP